MDPNDEAVDRCITAVQSALDSLKAAQKKDDAEEDSEPARDLKTAAGSARRMFADRRKAAAK